MDFNFSTSHAEYVEMTGLEDNPLGLSGGETATMDKAGDYGFKPGEFWDHTDEDGLYKFVVKFKDDRTFTFDVWYYEDTKKYEDDIAIDVEKATVVFDMPATCVIGEDLTIKGTVSAGESVAIYIDDDLFEASATLTDGVFDEDWDTKGEKTGSYRIDVYIDLEDKMTPPADKDDIPAGIEEDGTTTVRLIAPELDAEQPRDVIAEGDDYTIEGTATGVDEVDIVLIGPNGYPPADPGLDVLNGLEITSTSVDDNEFSEDITITEGLDLGSWITMVFSPGCDGEYGDLGIGAGELADISTSWFAGKTQAQIVAILMDHTVDVAGSDDLLEEFTFEVVSGLIFDTEPSENPYPSIMGTHNGTITPSYNINVSTLYTYACVGTGGHTESIELYENDELIANGTWNGYIGDYHNITLHNVSGAPYVMLLEEHKYNYTIRTGSYPQIIHARSKDVTGGMINCTEFIDANGKEYNNWIPAIRLE